MKQIVITGLGPVTPNGIGKEEFWNNIVNGNSFFETLSIVKNRSYGDVKGSEIKDFNLDDYFLQDVKKGKFNRKNYASIKSADKAMQFAVLGTKLALEDAVLEFDKEKNDIGVFVGNAEGLIQSTEEIIKIIIQTIMRKTFNEFDKMKPLALHICKIKREFKKYKALLQDDKLEKFITLIDQKFGNLYGFINPSKDYKNYAIPARISSLFNFHGTSICINTACSAGLDAIGYGYKSIKLGERDIAVVGGSEAPITLQSIALLNNLGVISKNKPKPYCIDRDGFAISEGAGIIVLEEKQHALERGAKIYAEIKGYSQSNDASTQMAVLNQKGTYLKKSIKEALKQSKLSKEQIGYINTHGTATKDCDLIETNVIKEIFREYSKKLNISSTKSMTGHSIGAIGGIEAIIASLTTKENIVPPTINLDNPDPQCDLNYTPNNAVEKSIRNSLVISMGFGGYNAALILGEYEEK